MSYPSKDRGKSLGLSAADRLARPSKDCDPRAPLAPSAKSVERPLGTGGLRVYSEVRERILNMRLAPGEELSEPDLVREFGVSRTLVREALIPCGQKIRPSQFPDQRHRVNSCRR